MLLMPGIRYQTVQSLMREKQRFLNRQFMQPNAGKKIRNTENGQYLAKYIETIAIRKTDVEENNGGCTEPHISHILASRLSTRPMAWSGETLTHLAPILAGNDFNFAKQTKLKDLPLPLKTAEVRARRKAQRGSAGLPSPDSIGNPGINGKITGTQKILKFYC